MNGQVVATQEFDHLALSKVLKSDPRPEPPHSVAPASGTDRDLACPTFSSSQRSPACSGAAGPPGPSRPRTAGRTPAPPSSSRWSIAGPPNCSRCGRGRGRPGSRCRTSGSRWATTCSWARGTQGATWRSPSSASARARWSTSRTCRWSTRRPRVEQSPPLRRRTRSLCRRSTPSWTSGQERPSWSTARWSRPPARWARSGCTCRTARGTRTRAPTT